VARFWPVAGIAAVKGTIGSIVHRSRPASGLATSKTFRTFTPTANQRRASENARTVASLWRAMTPAERDAWDWLAANTQHTEDAASVDEWSGWEQWSAFARRWMLTNATIPNNPSTFALTRPDPPWLRIYPHTTPGQFRIWQEPPPMIGTIGTPRYLIYTGQPRPATRFAYRSDEVYRTFRIDSALLGSAPGELFTFAANRPWRRGQVVNVRAVTITDRGEVSGTFGWTVETLPVGRTLYACVFAYLPWSLDSGSELTPAGILRVWSTGWPRGTPDVEIDCAASGYTVSQVRSAIAGVFPMDSYTVTVGVASRPWSDLIPWPPRRMSFRDAAILLTVPT
jgi:hypothetical protein